MREHSGRWWDGREGGLKNAECVVDRGLHPEPLLANFALDVLPRVCAHGISLRCVDSYGPADGFAFAEVPVLLVGPFAEKFGTAGPAVLTRDTFGGDAMFVGAIGVRPVEKKSEDDLLVPVCGRKMERG